MVHQKWLSAIVSTIGEGLTKFGALAVALIGGWVAIGGGLSAGDVVAFLGYLAVMYSQCSGSPR